MGDYVVDQTKKGWLTAILELGAWLESRPSPGALKERCERLLSEL